MINKYVVLHREFNLNKKGRDFFVGDIHGQYDLLMIKLKSIAFNPLIDRLFSVGDIINKGEQSEACLSLLKKPWFFAVKGNHEELLLSMVNNPEVIEHLNKVGGQWLAAYADTPREIKYFIALIYLKTTLAMTVNTPWGRVGVIHAQAPDDWNDITQETISKEAQDHCVWGLSKYRLDNSCIIQNIDATVQGHVNCEATRTKGNQIWIDTLKQTGTLTIISAEDVFRLIQQGGVRE